MEQTSLSAFKTNMLAKHKKYRSTQRETHCDIDKNRHTRSHCGQKLFTQTIHCRIALGLTDLLVEVLRPLVFCLLLPQLQILSNPRRQLLQLIQLLLIDCEQPIPAFGREDKLSLGIAIYVTFHYISGNLLFPTSEQNRLFALGMDWRKIPMLAWSVPRNIATLAERLLARVWLIPICC